MKKKTRKKETAALSVKGLAISLGVIGAIYVFALGLYGMAGRGLTMMNMMGSMYLGYGPTLLGSLIGAIYGFIDGAIAGAIIAWIYNKVVEK